MCFLHVVFLHTFIWCVLPLPSQSKNPNPCAPSPTNKTTAPARFSHSLQRGLDSGWRGVLVRPALECQCVNMALCVLYKAVLVYCVVCSLLVFFMMVGGEAGCLVGTGRIWRHKPLWHLLIHLYLIWIYGKVNGKDYVSYHTISYNLVIGTIL